MRADAKRAYVTQPNGKVEARESRFLLPDGIPAARFWSLTVYDTEQRESLASALCNVTDAEVPTLRSPKVSGVMAAVGRDAAANAKAEG